MARSDHASYTAADRYERKASRRQSTPSARRQRTRHAVIAAALRDA